MRLCNFDLNSTMHKKNFIFKGIKYQLFNDFILSELIFIILVSLVSLVS